MTGKHHFFLFIKDLLREGRALKDYQGLSRIIKDYTLEKVNTHFPLSHPFPH